MAKKTALQRTMVRRLMKLAVLLYRRSGGRIGGTLKGAPVLLLSTTGRKSGKTWTTPLIYQHDEQRLIVIASNAGCDKHPSWWLNLRSTPRAVVELGRNKIEVTASEASDATRDRLWALMAAVHPGYNDYTTRTTRRLPVVVLDPVAP